MKGPAEPPQVVIVPSSFRQGSPEQGGGVQTFVDMLTRVASGVGLELVVPCIGKEDIDGSGFRFVAVGGRARSEFEYARLLRRWANREASRLPRGAVVLANAEHYAWAMAPSGLPTILMAHGVASETLRMRRGRLLAWAFKLLIEKPVVRRCVKLIGVSSGVLTYYLTTYPESVPGKAIRWSAGVRLEDFEARPRSPVRRKYDLSGSVPILLFVGRLSPEKNVQLFVSSCDLLFENGSQFHAVIVGDGPERNRIERALRTRPWMHWIPATTHDEVLDFMSESRVLVIGSTYEGLPTVLLEAIASGLPVVTTAVGMSQDLVHWPAGLIVGPDPKEVVDGIRKVMSVTREAIRAATIPMRDRIDFNASAQQLAIVIRQVAAGSRRGSIGGP